MIIVAPYGALLITALQRCRSMHVYQQAGSTTKGNGWYDDFYSAATGPMKMTVVHHQEHQKKEHWPMGTCSGADALRPFGDGAGKPCGRTVQGAGALVPCASN